MHNFSHGLGLSLCGVPWHWSNIKADIAAEARAFREFLNKLILNLVF